MQNLRNAVKAQETRIHQLLERKNGPEQFCRDLGSVTFTDPWEVPVATITPKLLRDRPPTE
jgi:hypothetical protein